VIRTAIVSVEDCLDPGLRFASSFCGIELRTQPGKL